MKLEGLRTGILRMSETDGIFAVGQLQEKRRYFPPPKKQRKKKTAGSKGKAKGKLVSVTPEQLALLKKAGLI